jgi:hypothetical protein
LHWYGFSPANQWKKEQKVVNLFVKKLIFAFADGGPRTGVPARKLLTVFIYIYNLSCEESEPIHDKVTYAHVLDLPKNSIFKIVPYITLFLACKLHRYNGTWYLISLQSR